MAAKNTETDLKRALVVGASGLVGSHCLEYLLDDPLYSQVSIIVRGKLSIDHPKLVQHIIDFERLSSYRDVFTVNDVFCCLGIKGPVPANEFEKVEFTFPHEAGKIAASMGVDRFLIVTAMMCSPCSPVALFRVKGRLEAALKNEPLKALHFFKPSLIVGDRKDPRPDEESIAKLFKKMTVFTPFLRKYLYIEGKVIARSMVLVAKQNLTGIHSFSVGKIQKMVTQCR